MSLLVGVFLFGTLGYAVIGAMHGRDWSLLDCAYMTGITLSTVGYGDTLDAYHLASGRVFTLFLIVGGMGSTLYSVSALTAVIVEGHLRTAFQEARMQRRIDKLSGHTIICGCGETGIHVVHEHQAVGQRFVVIDKDLELMRRLAEEDPDFLYVIGDGTRDEVLEAAGLSRASTLAATLSTDKDNLYLVVTARYVNDDVTIVARCDETEFGKKFLAAGANHVVSPSFIGGMRIASQVLRPNVVNFLDRMLRADDQNVRFAEVTVQEGSRIAGKTLSNAGIGKEVGMLVVAVQPPDNSGYKYSPKGDTVLDPGTVMIVLGPSSGMDSLHAMVSS